MPFLRILPACLLAAALCLAGLCGSCVPRRDAAPEPRSIQESATLPGEEARALCAGLSPSGQGLASFTDLAQSARILLDYARSKPQDAPAFVRPGLTLTYGDLARANALFLSLLPELDRDPSLLSSRFALVPLGGPTLITGYYFPRLEASLTPAPGYGHPLYGPPPGPLRKSTRAEIDYGGALAGKGLEAAWARDPVDLFFLHVQGSGILVLPDGRTVYAAYAGNNGARYRAIGGAMIADGLFEPSELSMQRIKEALREDPARIAQYLPQNPRYAYFMVTDREPRGALGAPLHGMSAAASDPAFTPLGGLLLYDARLPDPDGGTIRARGLALVQDTGTMRGNHVDLFCGEGEEAAYRAGRMKGRGMAYLLAPRDVVEKSGAGRSDLAGASAQGDALP